MIKVYHVIQPKFLPLSPKQKDLHLVAEVDTDSLDKAYELTNTIDYPWWDNQGVKFLGSPQHGMDGCRSTSVGDVLEKDKKFFLVDICGFKEVFI